MNKPYDQLTSQQKEFALWGQTIGNRLIAQMSKGFDITSPLWEASQKVLSAISEAIEILDPENKRVQDED